MTTRRYSSRSQQTTLSGAITSGATSMTVVSGSALLGGIDSNTISATATFTVVIDPDTALEEIVDVTAISSNTLTIVRSADTVGGAQSHSAGAVVRHMAIGRDFRDANLHAEATTGYNDGSGTAHTMHGIAAGEGVVVGTDKAQTLTQKTLTTPTINAATITGAVTMSATATVTGHIVISGGSITGLSSAGMITSSAAPKDYVDSILGSATAASTSAASAALSASQAATSAANASVSAIAASTSAAQASVSQIAANTSAVAASTSAANASVSQIAANTSAINASTSAANALVSATSASASVAAVQASAVAAQTSAASASVSQIAASTSAANAAASAVAASTSAVQASTSAASASVSQIAANTSAINASTSAASASVSQIAANTSAINASTSAASAAASAVAANTSAVLAEAAWDSFDDRYLGPKASPPTVDNDGNPLTTGVIYYNTGDGNMYVWNGGTSSWQVFTSTGDITAVVAGTGLSGGGTSGSVTLDLNTSSVYVVPSQSGQNGKYLTTDGTTASWATIDLSSYATTATVQDNQILMIMQAQ